MIYLPAPSCLIVCYNDSLAGKQFAKPSSWRKGIVGTSAGEVDPGLASAGDFSSAAQNLDARLLLCC